MSRRLPSLTSLRAFEAAARHLSFSRAAEELHVTPTAVSHQVRSLEDWLETKLFVRSTRSVSLTDAGAVYLVGVLSAGHLNQCLTVGPKLSLGEIVEIRNDGNQGQ